MPRLKSGSMAAIFTFSPSSIESLAKQGRPSMGTLLCPRVWLPIKIKGHLSPDGLHLGAKNNPLPPKIERKKQTDTGRLPWLIVHRRRYVDGLRVVIGAPILRLIPIIAPAFDMAI